MAYRSALFILSPVAARLMALRSITAAGRQEFSELIDVYDGMWQRCTNPKNKNYRNYGARGIYVDARWQDFETFAHDVAPRPGLKYSLDRKNNDGPYSQDNCQWATKIQQNRNTRHCHLLTIDGVTKPISV
jgi:hypothetical protein